MKIALIDGTKASFLAFIDYYHTHCLKFDQNFSLVNKHIILVVLPLWMIAPTWFHKGIIFFTIFYKIIKTHKSNNGTAYPSRIL